MTRDYYNRRTGQDGGPPRLTLSEAAKLVSDVYVSVEGQGWLQRAFGYECVDAGDIPGTESCGMFLHFFLKTRLRLVGHVQKAIRTADEVFLFTFVEFIHDYVAKPERDSGWHHSFNGCGWHYKSDGVFDEVAARAEWRNKVNGALEFYEDGYQLSEAGEIVRIAPDGTAPLIQAQLPSQTSAADSDKVTHAIRTFHLGRSTRHERKQAVRDLFDVLEFHRPEVRKHLTSKDTSDLFHIANGFSLRHHNETQRDDYDDAFLTWMFYLNLSTVHLVLARVFSEAAYAPKSEPTPAIQVDDDIPF